MASDLVPFNLSLASAKNELSNGSMKLCEACIVTRVSRQTINLDYFRIDMKEGKLSFHVPYGYLHDFINKTIMLSDDKYALEEARYNVYVYFVLRGKK